MDRTQIASVLYLLENFICHLGRWKKGVDNFSKKSLSYTCTYTQIRVKSWFLPFE